MHHPEPFIAFPGNIELASRSPASGEYLVQETENPSQSASRTNSRVALLLRILTGIFRLGGEWVRRIVEPLAEPGKQPAGVLLCYCCLDCWQTSRWLDPLSFLESNRLALIWLALPPSFDRTGWILHLWKDLFKIIRNLWKMPPRGPWLIQFQSLIN